MAGARSRFFLALILFSSILSGKVALGDDPAIAWGTTGNFRTNPPVKFIRMAYILKDLKQAKPQVYKELISWMDNELERHFTASFLEGTTGISPYSYRHPFFGGAETLGEVGALEVELGLLYYLSEHAASQGLKERVLKTMLEKHPEGIGEAISASAVKLSVTQVLDEYAGEHQRSMPTKGFFVALYENIVAGRNGVPPSPSSQIERQRQEILDAIGPYVRFLGIEPNVERASAEFSKLLLPTYCAAWLRLAALPKSQDSAPPK